MAHPLHWAIMVLTFSGLHTPASTGIISDLPDDQVEQVLALYHQHCGSNEGYGGYGPSQGNVNIVCKEPKEYTAPQEKKVIKIPPQMNAFKKQVIFVEVPATQFKHEITLLQGPDGRKAPKIYVLPQEASHDVRVEDLRQAGQLQKPEVFFLKGGNNLDGGYPSGEYGPPSPMQPPSQNYGPPPSQSPPQNYGPLPPQSPPQNYGPLPPQSPPQNYGQPPSQPQSPPKNYGPPQPQSPPQNYGPPPSQPQSPPQNYGPPQPQSPPQNYGPPPSKPPPQGYSPEPAQTPDPISNYGAPAGPPPTSYSFPARYVVKKTYEIPNNNIGYTNSPLTYVYPTALPAKQPELPDARSTPQPYTTIAYTSPSDGTITALLKRISERLKNNPRRHVRYPTPRFPSTRTSFAFPSTTSTTTTTTTTKRPYYSPPSSLMSRFIFPSESRLVPIKALVGSSTRLTSLPKPGKFSSKFTYSDGIIKANEMRVNISDTQISNPVFISLTDDESTTPTDGDFGARLQTALTTPTTPQTTTNALDYSTNKDDESPVFDVLPATYLGYTYVVDGHNSSSSSGGGGDGVSRSLQDGVVDASNQYGSYYARDY